jgi:hypothetical protein
MSQDQARTTRIRDNKRRFRLRRKEYVADLERSLRELRQQGVQATREVQLSARKVARENVLLRQLLRSHGADENVVDEWIQGHEDTHSSGENAPVCAKRCNHITPTAPLEIVGPGISMPRNCSQSCRPKMRKPAQIPIRIDVLRSSSTYRKSRQTS